MIITKLQAQEIVGVGDTTFRRLVEEGKLTPVNKPKDGAKKFFAKFDSAAVRTYVKSQKESTKHVLDRIAEEVKAIPPEQVRRELDAMVTHRNTIPNTLVRLEKKLDALLAAWGITL